MNKFDKVIDVYKNAYTVEWERVKGKSSIRIVQHENPFDDNSPVVKTYNEDGNFFLCGFNWIHFSPKGNPGLRKGLESIGCRVRKDYPSGFAAFMPSFCLHGYGAGNGDFMIQSKAYEAVEEYLKELGYNVYADSRLD